MSFNKNVKLIILALVLTTLSACGNLAIERTQECRVSCMECKDFKLDCTKSNLMLKQDDAVQPVAWEDE